jgi:hypothetical protein
LLFCQGTRPPRRRRILSDAFFIPQQKQAQESACRSNNEERKPQPIAMKAVRRAASRGRDERAQPDGNPHSAQAYSCDAQAFGGRQNQ